MYAEMNQRSFASAEYAIKKKSTRREKFLVDMERVVPWVRLIGVIEPLYPTSGRRSAFPDQPPHRQEVASARCSPRCLLNSESGLARGEARPVGRPQSEKWFDLTTASHRDALRSDDAVH